MFATIPTNEELGWSSLFLYEKNHIPGEEQTRSREPFPPSCRSRPHLPTDSRPLFCSICSYVLYTLLTEMATRAIIVMVFGSIWVFQWETVASG
jgi:hypothetical protein